MSIEKHDKLTEFRARLKALVIEFDVELRANTGYYGEPEGIEVFCGEKSAAEYDSGCWNFGDSIQSVTDAEPSTPANTLAQSPRAV